MPDGQPSSLRVDPATGLPAVAQYVARSVLTPGILTGTSFVVGNFTLTYDGTFGVDDMGGTGYAPSPPAAVGSNTGADFSITDTGGLATITPIQENGIPLAPVATMRIAGLILLNVSAVNFRAAFAPYIDRAGLFGPVQYPTMGLLKNRNYQLALTQGAATRQDTTDITFISLRELR